MSDQSVTENDHCCEVEDKIKRLDASLRAMDLDDENFKPTAMEFIRTVGECPRRSADSHYITLILAYYVLAGIGPSSPPLAA